MRTQLNTRVPDVSPGLWRVPESANQQDERTARMAEMLARARKPIAKANIRGEAADRLACLLGMLDRLHREHASERSPERAGHLGDAVRDLETLIVRAILLR